MFYKLATATSVIAALALSGEAKAQDCVYPPPPPAGGTFNGPGDLVPPGAAGGAVMVRPSVKALQ